MIPLAQFIMMRFSLRLHWRYYLSYWAFISLGGKVPRALGQEKPNFKIFFVLTSCTLYLSYPLFIDVIYYGQDIYCHIARIEGIKEGLLSGQFPVRIHPQAIFNAGYPSSCFYPELFLYIPAILRLLGVSMPLSYNLFLVMINGATIAVSYFSFKHLFKDQYIGLFGSILYSSSIYRLMHLYTRAALGDSLVFIFLPLLIYGLYEIFFNDSKKWIYFVLACTGVLQSHILNTIIIAVFIVIFCTLSVKRLFVKERLFAFLKACGLLVLLNLWFLVPFIQVNLQGA